MGPGPNYLTRRCFATSPADLPIMLKDACYGVNIKLMKCPLMLRLGPLTNLSSSLASLARYGQGVFYRPAIPPEQLLELYNYEGSPFCRLVREALCELEINYLVRNVPFHSPSREAFIGPLGQDVCALPGGPQPRRGDVRIHRYHPLSAPNLRHRLKESENSQSQIGRGLPESPENPTDREGPGEPITGQCVGKHSGRSCLSRKTCLGKRTGFHNS